MTAPVDRVVTEVAISLCQLADGSARIVVIVPPLDDIGVEGWQWAFQRMLRLDDGTEMDGWQVERGPLGDGQTVLMYDGRPDYSRPLDD